MLTLGITGSFAVADDPVLPDLGRGFFHDAAACLIDGSGVVAAVEEERLVRDKHTNVFPTRAIRACLEQVGAGVADIDRVGYFWAEDGVDAALGLNVLRYPALPLRSARELLLDRLRRQLGVGLPAHRVTFVRHHDAHAASAWYQSGFAEGLVVVMDGMGEAEAVSVYHGTGDRMRLLRTHPITSSLGLFYTRATELLGYREFDEYKVMGLAPYGDPEVFRKTLDRLLRLRDDGEFDVDMPGLQQAVIRCGFRPRRAGEPILQVHKDLAAAVQHTLERVVFHLLGYWRSELGLPDLAIAGGVAQNSAANGRVRSSGLFERMFIQPASHDAGAALGAAALVALDGPESTRPATAASLALRDVYLGPDLAARGGISRALNAWDDFVVWERPDDIAARAAGLLAAGKVIGWAQGRSEFGPRALGNRSILADPRPAGNRERINALIKNRESYRPFAPAVPAEVAADYFDLSATACPLDYMGCVVDVRPEHRALLGAVTHVDGTARVQIVRRASNEPFWRLINRFGELTGVPVVLNTSLNNNAEPIVQTADDAIVTFLTSGLDHLVLGDLLVGRRPDAHDRYATLGVRLAPFVDADATVSPDADRVVHRIYRRGYRDTARALSAPAFRVLCDADPTVPLSQLGGPDLVDEFVQLWLARLVQLRPTGR
jgi:predicted NodU family carbamoyl transferase